MPVNLTSTLEVRDSLLDTYPDVLTADVRAALDALPFSASSLLLGSLRNSSRVVAASRISSCLYAWRAKPWKARTNRPSANVAVRLSR